MAVNLNVEKFIGDIFDRPPIWNGSMGNKDALWYEISVIHELPIHPLKTKWENLRRSFRNQLKKIPRNVDNVYLTSPFDWQTLWPYYRSMLFLVNQTRLAPPIQAVPVNIDSSRAIPIDGGRKRANVGIITAEDNSGAKIRRTNSDTSLASTVEFNEDAAKASIVNLNGDEFEIKKSSSMATTLNWGDNKDSCRGCCDSDRFYLKSLLHYFSKLDYSRKLEVREKIDRILIEAVGKKGNEV